MTGGESRCWAREGEFYRAALRAGRVAARTAAARRPLPLPPYIQRARPGRRTASATRPSSRATRRRRRAHRRPALHAGAAGCARGARRAQRAASPCTSAPAPSSRCAATTSREHRMHSEWLERRRRDCARSRAHAAAGGRVVAVGTTVVRALETAAARRRAAPDAGETRIFICPRLPLPQRRCAGHQLPPARVDAAHAGVGLRRPRARPRRLRATRCASATASSATATRCCCSRHGRHRPEGATARAAAPPPSIPRPTAIPAHRMRPPFPRPTAIRAPPAVIPAQADIEVQSPTMDSRLRGNDGMTWPTRRAPGTGSWMPGGYAQCSSTCSPPTAPPAAAGCAFRAAASRPRPSCRWAPTARSRR